MKDSKKKSPDLHVGKVISELGGDELNLLFSLVQRSGKLPEAKRLLKNRDPNTVARAFLVIEALIIRNKKNRHRMMKQIESLKLQGIALLLNTSKICLLDLQFGSFCN
jgi:hypothetical protein